MAVVVLAAVLDGEFRNMEDTGAPERRQIWQAHPDADTAALTLWDVALLNSAVVGKGRC